MTDLLKALGVKAVRPVNNFCDRLCAHYNHIFCDYSLSFWDDSSECEHCDKPYFPFEDEEEEVPEDYKHADGDHEFWPKMKPQPWPLPQICKLVTRGMLLGARWEKPPTNVEGLH